MSADDRNEATRARLAGILEGPWTKGGDAARRLLRCTVRPLPIDGIIDLDDVVVGRADSKREAKLVHLFRPHWEEAIDEEEIDDRNALDEALTELQLLELAVETGYLDVADIRQHARERLVGLLWSRGARNFVRAYDYVAVGWLAHRVDVVIHDISGKPPAPIEAPVRFATFLSEVRHWAEDEALESWFGFLDDYQVIGDDMDKFAAFVRRGKAPRSEQAFLEQLLAGARSFTRRLAALAERLTPEERQRYGVFVAYWLAKFHGEERGADGYATSDWLEEWSKLLDHSLRDEVPDGTDADLARVLIGARRAERERLAILRTWWAEVRAFLEAR